jgi:hypothetical protein
MAALSAFTPRIAYRVDGCPDITIEQAVLDACIDFCERSLILRQTLDPTAVVAGVKEVDLDLPSGTRLAKIMKVWVDDREISAVSEDEVGTPLAHVDSVPGVTGVSSMPTGYVESSPGTIRLYPAPDKTYSVTVRAALKPSRSATAVDDILFENWVNAITEGALARLYVMPEVWGNAALAAVSAKAFLAFVSSASTEAQHGRGRGELRVRPVWI